MSKFDGLINYLNDSNEESLLLSFDFIEELIGQDLCYSAKHYDAYWQPAGHCLPKHILNTGYSIYKVDKKQETIMLKKTN